MNPLKKNPRTRIESPIPPKPDWLKARVSFPKEEDSVSVVRSEVKDLRLHTVCESASCPNLNHCWSRKTATYMLAGDICTRRCSYCDVAFGKPSPLDPREPERVAQSVSNLNLNHVVLTAVNRDDLPDGGAMHFANTIRAIRASCPKTRIEVLIPDFQAKDKALQSLYDSKPDIINHNLETVRSLFAKVAPSKDYERSLSVLSHAKKNGFFTKSGIILGLGENKEEVAEALRELQEIQVDALTLGQYLQPSTSHLPIDRFVEPKEFEYWKEYAKKLGFRFVFSGPLVRSSYHADEQYN